jgi:hypothetical protein
LISFSRGVNQNAVDASLARAFFSTVDIPFFQQKKIFPMASKHITHSSFRHATLNVFTESDTNEPSFLQADATWH